MSGTKSLELPVVAPEVVIPPWKVPLYLPDANAAQFTRPVDIWIGRNYQSLDPQYWQFPDYRDVLSVTDNELSSFAQKCGALVIPHTWGQTSRTTEDSSDEFLKKLKVPASKRIVATVDLLKDIDEPTAQQEQLIKQTTEKYMTKIARNEPTLGDMSPLQFVTGVNTAKPQLPRALWLVDIEPLLIWSKPKLILN